MTPERAATPDGLVTITHSASQSIVTNNSVSCNAGGLHTDNSYLRQFDLNAFGITDTYNVTQVEIGVEQAVGAGGSQPITVNFYTKINPAGALTLGQPDTNRHSQRHGFVPGVDFAHRACHRRCPGRLRVGR